MDEREGRGREGGREGERERERANFLLIPLQYTSPLTKDVFADFIRKGQSPQIDKHSLSLSTLFLRHSIGGRLTDREKRLVRWDGAKTHASMNTHLP